MNEIKLGDTLTCAETGKQFIAAACGITTNYAHDREGNVYSDEGVDIGERRALLDRSKPFTGYLSEDAYKLTGWKGNVLGRVTRTSTVKVARRSYAHGPVLAVRVIDIHGGEWFGRGSPGMCITLRPCKFNNPN